MKYRSRTDIISGILQAAEGGATKTRIMYGAFVSYAQLQDYLSFLLSKGLLAHDPTNGLYTQTEKGSSFMQSYEELRDLCDMSPGSFTVGNETALDSAQPVSKRKKSEMDSRPNFLE
jgi:predicted transcriptional regulator